MTDKAKGRRNMPDREYSRGWHWHYSGAETREGRERAVSACIKVLEGLKGIDTIGVVGRSGLLVGAPLSYLTGLKLLIAQKSEERSHETWVPAIGEIGEKMLLIDDFCCSGGTILSALKKFDSLGNKFILDGIYMYADGLFIRKGDLRWNQKWDGPFLNITVTKIGEELRKGSTLGLST